MSSVLTAVPTKVRYSVLGFTLALTAISYLDRVRISMAAPAIKADLGLTDTQMGYVFSAFMLSYALFEIPAGWMADRFGPRITLVRIVIWWTVMSALTGAATGFWSLFIVRLLFGMGEAGTFPGISRVFVRWLPPREHGRAFGFALMLGALAGALSQPLMAALLSVMSWRYLFPLFSVVGIAWVIFWLLWFRDDPHSHPAVNAAELREIGSEPPSPQPPVPWRALIRSRNLIALCLVCGSWLYGWYFWLTWLPSYLLRARGFDLRETGWLAALPLACSAAGLLAGGWASDILSKKWGSRRGRRAPALLCLPLAVLAIFAGILVVSPLASALYLSVAAGLAALGLSPIFAVCLQIGGKHAGVVTGTMNMAGNLIGALCPVVVGWSVQHLSSWNIPLMSVAVFYLFAAVCWLMIDPEVPIQPIDVNRAGAPPGAYKATLTQTS
jgi:MFS family permease